MAERHESCRGEVVARGHAGRQEPEPRPEAPAGGEFDGPLWVACNRCGLTRIEQHLDVRGGADGIIPCVLCGGRGIVQTGCHPLPMASLADAVDGGAA